MAAGAASAGLAYLLTRFPPAAELYANAIGPLVVGGLSRLSGIVPFALAEWVLVAFVLRQLIGAGRGLAQVSRGRRAPGNSGEGLTQYLPPALRPLRWLWWVRPRRRVAVGRQGEWGMLATCSRMKLSQLSRAALPGLLARIDSADGACLIGREDNLIRWAVRSTR